MFNYQKQTVSSGVSAKQLFGGYSMTDSNSYVTLFAGPDPADSDRMLVRKLVQIGIGSYAYEETRVNRKDGGSVHTTLTKVHGFDLNEKVSNHELNIRGMHRAMPNVLAYSLYFRPSAGHLSIVENSLWKTSGTTWSDWWRTVMDRRDMSAYLQRRWNHF